MNPNIKEINLDNFSYPWYERLWDFVYRNKHFNIGYAVERTIKNVRFYWNVLRFDYDFDAQGYLRMLYYKLSEVEKCLLHDEYHDHNPKHMQALKLAVKLSKRLSEENYNERPWRKIEQKYGKWKSWTEPNDNKTVKFKCAFGNNLEPKNNEKVRKEHFHLIMIAERCMYRDERNLYAILLKYRQNWWS